MFLLQHLLLYLFVSTITDTFQAMDLATLEALNSSRITDLDILLLALTMSAYGLGAVVPVALYLLGHVRKSAALRLKAFQYLLAMCLMVGVIGALKYTVNRTRPFVGHNSIERIAEASSPSFPSGHTAFAFTAAVALALMFRNAPLRVTVLAWAVLVAYSRLALGVHYPSDVLASILIGTTAAIVAHHTFRKYGSMVPIGKDI
ncbi:phosphatase PAP2 family protein [Pontibacter chinhatensis]|uniref:Membrane-associated phospholipid phosphatase n=1 Tax=Pontibacter chinhatensis TaxID=1436961 RepID=A0A1I2X7F5_9BACT|nr:phosphatase PAP2 family protein [Pontibacter chinhatensis]SFH08957.1 Membrane-associated phospholipid phosphatase [Pontibacter chinhatensis]